VRVQNREAATAGIESGTPTERRASSVRRHFGEEAGEFLAGVLEFAFDLALFLTVAVPKLGAQFLDMLFERDHRHLLVVCER
jgi:hypothetical protein